MKASLGTDRRAPYQQGHIRLRSIEQLQLKQPAARAQHAFHQIRESESTMQSAGEGFLALIKRGGWCTCPV